MKTPDTDVSPSSCCSAAAFIYRQSRAQGLIAASRRGDSRGSSLGPLVRPVSRRCVTPPRADAAAISGTGLASMRSRGLAWLAASGVWAV